MILTRINDCDIKPFYKPRKFSFVTYAPIYNIPLTIKRVDKKRRCYN